MHEVCELLDFGGASIRHQLYTLALKHFGKVYASDFERPKLCPSYRRLIRRGGVLVVEGRMQREGGVVNVVARGFNRS